MAITVTNATPDEVKRYGQLLHEEILLATGAGDTSATVGAAGSGQNISLKQIERIVSFTGATGTVAANGQTAALDLLASKTNRITFHGLG